jgi:fimbrial isopeptide formation D2 family protein/LPXTG-motif cell wall-anchored protein
MNRLKKYASLLLALVMALALAVPAVAGENVAGPATSKLTINNATANHTYTAYQIFDGDLSYNSDEEAVLSNITWGADVDPTKVEEALGKLGLPVSLANQPQTVADALAAGKYTPAEGEGDEVTIDAKAFAQAIGGALTLNSGTAKQPVPVYDQTDSEQVVGYKCEFEDLDAGYYLVKDTSSNTSTDGVADAVSLFMLQVVGPTEVNSKVGVPTPDKKIVEGENKVNTGDYDIGETITFELSATLPSNYEYYKNYKLVFHDTMSKGLDFIAIQSVVVNGENVTNNPNNGYTVAEPQKDEKGENSELTITFENLKASYSDLASGNVITITYTAKLNAFAEVGNPGNPNKMNLEFSNNPNDGGDGETDKTPDKEVLVFTYELDADKVDGNDKTTALEGAEFVLKLKSVENGENGESSEKVQYAVINAVTGKFIRWSDSRIDETNDAGETTKLVSKIDTETGKAVFKVSGIDAGTYWLEETKAPVGYNLPDPAETKITITAKITDNNGVAGKEDALTYLNISVGEEVVDPAVPGNGNLADGIVNTTIENNKGATLPETGGIGTTIFYALGGLLTVGAVVLLVTKKRMSADEK